MTVRDFLKRIQDSEGPLKVMALDAVNQMGDNDLRELADDMQRLVDEEAAEWARNIMMEEVKP